MCKKTYLVISGIIFGLVTIGHVGRLICHLKVQVGDWAAPLWLSWVGAVVAGFLSGWAFCLLCQKCKRDGHVGQDRPTK